MVNVIGLGYIGLPTALMLAAHGVDVTGTDLNEERVDCLNRDCITFKEKGLEILFKKACEKGIRFTSKYIQTDIYIIAVPTPYDKKSKKLDPAFVTQAVEKIIKICKKGAIIVIESTISPGTVNKYIRPLIEKKGLSVGQDIHLAHAPERIIPGNMIYELEHNARTIGTDCKEIGEKIKKLYLSFCKGEIVITDIKTAEMTKVVENTYRDINIAFANELAKICHSDQMDVYEIIKIANKHPRVNILSPGPGVGGHCISVDPWFLVGDYPGLVNIILAARKINDSMPQFVLKRAYEIMKERNISDISRIGVYGLTYKEDVDDMRESPSLQMLAHMEENLAGGRVKIYDPYIKHQVYKNQYYDFDAFISDIDFIIIMVGHKEIRDKAEALIGKVILDTRNICSLEGTYHL